MGTLTLGVNLILALASLVLTEEGCSSWSQEEQANINISSNAFQLIFINRLQSPLFIYTLPLEDWQHV